MAVKKHSLLSKGIHKLPCRERSHFAHSGSSTAVLQVLVNHIKVDQCSELAFNVLSVLAKRKILDLAPIEFESGIESDVSHLQRQAVV